MGKEVDAAPGGREQAMASVKQYVHGLTFGEVADECASLGQPGYRADQVWNWLYTQRVSSWGEMKNLPSLFRRQLEERFEVEPVKRVKMMGESPGTRKILGRLRDGEFIEMVLIPAADRRTLCVSSQVGCRFACAFCASGKDGFRRNLDAGEIVGQFLLGWIEYGERPTNVVYMGMGEPLDNYDDVMKSIRILNDPKGIAMGARHITISTSGIVEGIERLMAEGLQTELSVSLHASDDRLRDRLMPVNRRYPTGRLMDVCSRYAAATKRIVTFEYTLILGVNDSREQALALARLVKTVPSRINLIPLSPVDGFQGKAPPEATARMFVEVLEKAGINATIRVSKGAGISAACGQLRRQSTAGCRREEEVAAGGGENA